MDNSKERQYEIMLEAIYSLEDERNIDDCLDSITNYSGELPLMFIIYIKKLSDLVNYKLESYDVETVTEFMYLYFPDYGFNFPENGGIPYEKILNRIYERVINDKNFINTLLDKNCDFDNFEMIDYCVFDLTKDNFEKVIDNDQICKIFTVNYRLFENLDIERIRKILFPMEY